MPRLSVWLIRAAMLNLYLGFGLATLLMAYKAFPAELPPQLGGWLLAHVNLLLVGWMVQLAMGVSYWIFPRLAFTNTERGRYPYALGAAIGLNGGVWLYVLSTLGAWPWGEVLGLGLQVLAMAAYVYHAAPRIRAALVLT
jgi:hypothetical protein